MYKNAHMGINGLINVIFYHKPFNNSIINLFKFGTFGPATDLLVLLEISKTSSMVLNNLIITLVLKL